MENDLLCCCLLYDVHSLSGPGFDSVLSDSISSIVAEVLLWQATGFEDLMLMLNFKFS